MSLKTIHEELQLDNLVELEEAVERLEKNFRRFCKSNPGFSVKIEQHTYNNTIIVKGLFLEEHVN